ncbi:unnamed protein product [Cuscuta europaea]|uniref:SNARE-complex protein Syntaxin-18 N-terminal domain-containing protein n=1 Tax=Cuscuta europaea TaxID=41803 RepID=A0A9P0ZGA5_CUSEU|nr:unnamed protein product [Cuscuta europaea]
MVNIRDRTDDFKDAVHRSAVSLGFDETRIAAILASFIMRKPRQRSPFIKAALKTVDSIGVLEEFMLKHKKDYVDLYHTTEQERHSIENEVTFFIKSCKEQIDLLKTSINQVDDAKSKGWIGFKDGSMNADTVAHKHGALTIISSLRFEWFMCF